MSNSPDDKDINGQEEWLGAAVKPVADVRKPRVWPLFVVSLGVLIAAFVLQVVAAIVILFATREGGQTIQEAAQTLQAKLLDVPVFILMFVMSGLLMVVAAFLFGSISAKCNRCSVRERLGLQWPPISNLAFVSLLLGSIPVLLVAVGAVILVETVVPADDSLLSVYENMTTGWAIAFILLIGLSPGFSEELFFRGYLQRRFLQRFHPAVAIGITSVLFGIFHITPHGIALATILGVWLGVIAWRTNSIWPSACCHAFVNSSWNIYQVGRINWGIPEIPPVWFIAVGGAVSLAAFAIAVRFLIVGEDNRLSAGS